MNWQDYGCGRLGSMRKYGGFVRRDGNCLWTREERRHRSGGGKFEGHFLARYLTN